ncbi:hypothetical protein KDA_22350 [Dictyobacter alpinus]|uniref:GtrA/DPMS transmembrane domain-containing protein n=1 Tax=Dictyobacter alpinus TaxID=2014873 RepID=A0A402B5W5_9CHLR|nr:GtrA family protein [Dictyobacter alpinus]GCE26751.1 hypothetical protein KDA_22350 [Dictyobacter alpinus]
MLHTGRNIQQQLQRLNDLLFSRAARPVRFICTGGLAAVIQLTILNLLVKYGWESAWANVVAFLIAAQFNFVMSFFFTWRDRQPATDTAAKHLLLSRWLSFHSSILFTALLNQLVFIATRAFIPTLFASALGICVASLVNFFTMNTLVFRKKQNQDVVSRQSLDVAGDKQELMVANEKQLKEENV